MSFWADQLILLPILLPLLFAAALVLLSGRRQQLKFAINLIGTLALLATAITLFWFTDREVWPQGVGVYLAANWAARSEEHTSELQSRPHLVCRLLLEKKKK